MRKFVCVWMMSVICVACSFKPAGGQDLEGLEALASRALQGEAPGRFVLALLLGHLDLSQEQKQEVKTIVATQRASLQVLFQQLQAENRQLAKQLLEPGATNPLLFDPQIQRISQLREQLLREGLASVLAVRAILTPEQWAKVEQLKARVEQLSSARSGPAQAR